MAHSQVVFNLAEIVGRCTHAHRTLAFGLIARLLGAT